jgi:hypothetical protein
MSATTASGLDIETLERLSEMHYQDYLVKVAEFKEAANVYADDPSYANQLRAESTLRQSAESYGRHRAFYIHFNPVDSYR